MKIKLYLYCSPKPEQLVVKGILTVRHEMYFNS